MTESKTPVVYPRLEVREGKVVYVEYEDDPDTKEDPEKRALKKHWMLTAQQ